MGTIEVPVAVSEECLAALDAAVAAGRFASRSEAIADAVRRAFSAESKAAVGESYRRAYEKRPEESWVGRAGAHLLQDRVATERRR